MTLQEENKRADEVNARTAEIAEEFRRLNEEGENLDEDDDDYDDTPPLSALYYEEIYPVLGAKVAKGMKEAVKVYKQTSGLYDKKTPVYISIDIYLACIKLYAGEGETGTPFYSFMVDEMIDAMEVLSIWDDCGSFPMEQGISNWSEDWDLNSYFTDIGIEAQHGDTGGYI